MQTNSLPDLLQDKTKTVHICLQCLLESTELQVYK